MIFAAVVVGVAVLGYVAQMARWLRVLQREHYEPSSMFRFLGRWSSPSITAASSRIRQQRPITLTHVAFVATAILALLRQFSVAALVSGFYAICAPWGLSLRGRTSKLVWTRRLATVATLDVLIIAAVILLAALAHRIWWGLLIVLWFVPVSLDLSTRLLTPLERRRAQKFVDVATRRLSQVSPRVVAITGSFGKTSTKNHLFDLLSGDGGVIATPKSFNNRAGLSRSINEQLVDDTRLFIAEMGTYGPGEIAELCSWCVPEISVISAIGPVHLERMGSLEVIESAKFEITQRASTVVLNVDDERLARWPARLTDKKVITASSTSSSDVRVAVEGQTWVVHIHGIEVARRPLIVGLAPTNVACAIAVALEVGATTSELTQRLARLSPVPNRSVVATAASGVVVVDDTFNANPVSARAALDVLAGLDVAGRRLVVTPGLIELGREQHGENLRLAQEVRARGCELIVVGRTNAESLLAGFGTGAQRVNHRDEAVALVRRSLRGGDAVLYLNDLPDHYP